MTLASYTLNAFDPPFYKPIAIATLDLFLVITVSYYNLLITQCYNKYVSKFIAWIDFPIDSYDNLICA